MSNPDFGMWNLGSRIWNLESLAIQSTQLQTRTRRQKEVLDFITRYIDSHGYEPSYQMIARQIGVSSKAGIAKHIKALEEQGLLARRRENGSFSLVLNRKEHAAGDGSRIEWLEVSRPDPNREDWEDEPFHVPPFLLGVYDAERLLAFRIRDDAMAAKTSAAAILRLSKNADTPATANVLWSP
jgi:SOS-response transcriptional repressor LexA